MSTQEDFYSKLKDVFKSTGKTQQQFSEETGINRSTLAAYLTGRAIPDIEKIGKLCKTLNVSADWLLGLSDTRKPDPSARAVVEYIGLSEDAVQFLHDINLGGERRLLFEPNDSDVARIARHPIKGVISYLLSNAKGRTLLDLIVKYLCIDFAQALPVIPENFPNTIGENPCKALEYESMYGAGVFTVSTQTMQYSVGQMIVQMLNDIRAELIAKGGN